MSSHTAATFAAAVVLLVLLSVLGAVSRRERVPFVVGVVLILVGPTAVSLFGVAEWVAAASGALGFLVVVASAVPLLGQSATTS